MTSKRPRLQGQWRKYSLKKFVAGTQYISGMSVSLHGRRLTVDSSAAEPFGLAHLQIRRTFRSPDASVGAEIQCLAASFHLVG
jgi:hypothetical protein